MIIFIILLMVLCTPFLSMAQEDSSDPNTLISKGDAAFEEENFKAAVDAYREAIKLDPSNIKALHNLAVLYISASDPEYYDGNLAVELAIIALDHSPDNPEIINTLAYGYYAQNKFERAISECRKCIDLNPFEAEYHMMLKKYASTWKAQLEMKRSSGDVLAKASASFALGLACYYLGDLDKAGLEFESACNLKKDEKEYCLYRARVKTANGDPTGAFNSLQNIELEIINDAEILYELGRACHKSGELNQAETYYKDSERINPGQIDLGLDMARLYLEKGRFVKALIALKEVLSSLDRTALFAEDVEAEALYLLGKAFTGADEKEDGILNIFKALCLDPDLEGAEKDLTTLYMQRFGTSKGLDKHLVEQLSKDVVSFADSAGDSGIYHTGFPAFGDFDGDLDPDLLISGKTLYQNNGRNTFKDVTEKMGLADADGSKGLFADFDNDGDLDIYIVIDRGGWKDRIYRNDGKKGFVRVEERDDLVTGDLVPTQTAAIGDFNGDGLLDIFLANGGEVRGIKSKSFGNSLLIGMGDCLFKDVSIDSGLIDSAPQYSIGASLSDYDNDGDLDIFVANSELEPNRLYQNDGKGRFIDVSLNTDLAGIENLGRFGNSMGASFADIDKDGDLDLFVANKAEPRNLRFSDKSQFFMNSGRPGFRFVQKDKGCGIRYNPDHCQPLLGDFNNDGNMDLFMAAAGGDRCSRLYMGEGDFSFTDTTWLSGVNVKDVQGCAVADTDLDGDLDLIVGAKRQIYLFVNQGNKNHWIQLALKGSKSNLSGIGSRITVDYEGHCQIIEVNGGHGFGCQDSMIVHFGLGAYKNKVNVSIQWPDGRSSFIRALKTDRLHKLVEQN